MKKISLYLFTFLIVLVFNGCLATLSAAATAVSVVSTSQEVEEDYDGNFIEYIEDKVTDAYEYLEEKVSQE